MRYIRGRRLSIAALKLANGASDILAIALDAGYSSHEAFTRAFRDQFGCTPETVRRKGNLESISIVEPLRMNEVADNKLSPAEFRRAPELVLAGLRQHYACENVAGIPSQWQRFSRHIGNVPGQVGEDAFGVIFNADDEGNIDYLCGVQVEHAPDLPAELEILRIPACSYAVFEYSGHVANIRNAWSSIWNDSLSDAGHQPLQAPCFERYGKSFDPHTGQGGFELWVPVKESSDG